MVSNLFKNGKQLFERQQSNILSAAAIITGSVFLSAILGVARNRLLVSHFFVSKTALDAYWIAFYLPELVFQLLVIGALSAAFIPVYSKYKNQDPREAQDVANSMINIILLVFTTLSVIIFIWAEPFNKLITGTNFSPDQLALATKFTRIMLLAQFFFAISNFLTGIIQANHRFIIPALSPVAYNIGIIVGIIFLGPSLGLYGPTIGVVLGAFLHLVLQLPLAIKLGFKYRPVINLKLPGVREISRLMLPRTLALSVSELERLFVMSFLATSLSKQGALTILVLAQQLFSFPIRIFGMPIGQASLPFLSRESAQDDLNEFRRIFINSLHQILYLALPATAVLIVLRIPLVRIAYGAKAFPWADTLLTGKILAIFALSIFADASNHLITRAFYALHNTKIPMLGAIISLLVNATVSAYLVFYTPLGIFGIAIGGATATVLQSFYLFVSLLPRLSGFTWHDAVTAPAKILIASALTGLFLWFPMRLLDQYVFDTTRTLNLILLTAIVAAIGATVYFALSKVLAIKELDSYLSLFRKIGNWRKVLSSSSETLDQAETIQ